MPEALQPGAVVAHRGRVKVVVDISPSVDDDRPDEAVLRDRDDLDGLHLTAAPVTELVPAGEPA
jgi:hypothetical protein